MSAELKTELMAEYNARKKTEMEARSPSMSTVSTLNLGVIGDKYI